MNVLDEFKRLGNIASYHYADDTSREWAMGAKYKADALALFDANPELQAEMRQCRFLWSIEMERPSAV